METLYFYIAFGVLIVWTITLTVLYITAIRHYKKLSINKDQGLEDAINTIFAGLKDLDKRSTSIQNRVDNIEEESLEHIQKVAIKRFNPFGDTGGNQSFAVTFLDANDNGIVFSSLHGRSGTRIYGKPIKSGKQDGYELSEEEKDIINLAIKGDANGE